MKSGRIPSMLSSRMRRFSGRRFAIASGLFLGPFVVAWIPYLGILAFLPVAIMCALSGFLWELFFPGLLSARSESFPWPDDFLSWTLLMLPWAALAVSLSFRPTSKQDVLHDLLEDSGEADGRHA